MYNYNKKLNKKKDSISNFYKNKKILVTGASGFKGAWLCFWLHLMGSKVYGIGYSPNKNKNLFYQLKLNKKINYSLVDIKKITQLNKVIKNFKPQIVFHLAAQSLIFKSYKDPYNTYLINSFGTLNILEILKNNKYVKSIVCITSDKCYKSNNSTKGFVEKDSLGGEDPYSGSKASAEIIVNTYYQSFFKKRKLKCGLATARAGNVIGGGDWSPDRLIPDCIKSIINNKKIYLRNPNFNRPWQHVLEPLNGYLILAKKLYKDPQKYSSAWNFGSKKNTVTSVFEVVKKIIKYWGKGKIKINKNKFYEQKHLQLNINKSQKYLKWRPKLSISESIEQTINWYKQIYYKGPKTAEAITKMQIRDFINK